MRSLATSLYLVASALGSYVRLMALLLRAVHPRVFIQFPLQA
jgi:hypothetical protein